MDIFQAAETGNLARVKQCVSEGVDINSTDLGGKTVLFIGCQYNSVSVVEYLLNKGANTEIRENVHHWTAIIMAACSGHSDIVRLLVDHNVNINTQDKYGQTALWIASFSGQGDTVDILLANKADPNIRKNEPQSTALHVACENNHPDVVRMLLDHTTQVDAKDRDGETGLYKAAYEGHEQTVASLLQHGAGVNECKVDGVTPLYAAAQKGHAAVVDMLLDHGADIESKHIKGATPLIIACVSKHLNVVEILCEKGANINAVDNDGDTALHYTVLENSLDAAKVLLRYKPKVTHNKMGDTALDIAKVKKYRDLILLLEDYSKSSERGTSHDVSQAKLGERATESVKDYLDSLQSQLKEKKNLIQSHGRASDMTKINDCEVVVLKMLRMAELTEEAPEDATSATAATREFPLWKEVRRVEEEIGKLTFES